MIDLHLNHGNSHEGVYLRLPATPGEIGAAFGMLEKLGEGKVTIFDVSCPIRNISQYIIHTDINDKDSFAKLQRLAQDIDRMDRNERHIFSGALDAESINGLDDVLRIAGQLDQYTFISGVTNNKELGGYMVENGFLDFPQKVWPYLDYVGIGAEQYDKLGGFYAPGGYVLRKENAPRHEIDRARDEVFSLHLSAHYGAKHSFISLPASVLLLETTKRCLQIDEFAEADIEELDTLIPYLKENLSTDCISVEDANGLALCVEQMKRTDGELMKFLSVLSIENPDTFPDALSIAMNIGDYERVSSDPYEYGREYLRHIGASNEVIDALEGCTDFAALGQDRMKEDDVRYTEFGSVRSLNEPFRPQSQGMTMQ